MIRRSDWKTKPLTLKREKLGYEKFFSDADAEKLLNGYKPRDMDDKRMGGSILLEAGQEITFSV